MKTGWSGAPPAFRAIGTGYGELRRMLPGVPGCDLERRGARSGAARFPLHETLVAGPVDDAMLRPSSPWSNRLVLASVDLLDHEKYDTPAKLATAAALHSFRGRHLEHIVLTDATLPRSDFSSAHLEGASFVRVRAQGSWFDQSELEGANFDNSQLQGASFFSAHMPAASFQGAMLQGGRLAGATLEGAWFAEADLAAASLAGSDLRYAMLAKANLRGASLDGAQLQGASLHEAQLEGASLDGVSVWKTDFDGTLTGPRGFRIGHVSKLPCKPCDNADVPQLVHDLVMRYATGDYQTRELEWLKPELGPGPLPDWSPESKAALDRLETVTLTADDAELSNLWGGIVCSGAGAPFVLETLIDTVKEPGWTRPQYREGMIALVDRLLTDKHCAAQPAITDATKMQVLDLPGARERARKVQDEAHITPSP